MLRKAVSCKGVQVHMCTSFLALQWVRGRAWDVKRRVVVTVVLRLFMDHWSFLICGEAPLLIFRMCSCTSLVATSRAAVSNMSLRRATFQSHWHLQQTLM